MGVCGWAELKRRYIESVGQTAKEVAEGKRVGLDKSTLEMQIDQGQILQTLVNLYGVAVEYVEPPVVLTYCGLCRAMIEVDGHGVIQTDGECEKGFVFNSLTELAKSRELPRQ